MHQPAVIAHIIPNLDHLLGMRIKARQVAQAANTQALQITYRQQEDWVE